MLQLSPISFRLVAALVVTRVNSAVFLILSVLLDLDATKSSLSRRIVRSLPVIGRQFLLGLGFMECAQSERPKAAIVALTSSEVLFKPQGRSPSAKSYMPC